MYPRSITPQLSASILPIGTCPHDCVEGPVGSSFCRWCMLQFTEQVDNSISDELLHLLDGLAAHWSPSPSSIVVAKELPFFKKS